jgi:hypothetical protein
MRSKSRRSLLLFLLFAVLGSARAGVLVSAGQEFNYTFDFRDSVVQNGSGYAGVLIEGTCLTQTNDAQIWVQEINAGPGSVAAGAPACSFVGERFSTGGVNIVNIPDNDGLFTASLKVFSGGYLLDTMIAYFGWPPRIDPLSYAVPLGEPPNPVHLPGTAGLIVAASGFFVWFGENAAPVS